MARLLRGNWKSVAVKIEPGMAALRKPQTREMKAIRTIVDACVVASTASLYVTIFRLLFYKWGSGDVWPLAVLFAFSVLVILVLTFVVFLDFIGLESSRQRWWLKRALIYNLATPAIYYFQVLRR